VFQASGALVSLNEAAMVAALITLPATALIDHRPQRRLLILHAGRRLGEQLGGVNVIDVDEYYEHARSTLKAKQP
jgi:hypothetical protein